MLNGLVVLERLFDSLRNLCKSIVLEQKRPCNLTAKYFEGRIMLAINWNVFEFYNNNNNSNSYNNDDNNNGYNNEEEE